MNPWNRLARAGDGNEKEVDRLQDLSQERLESVTAAVERAWGRLPQVDHKLVVCDAHSFEQLFPDHNWWVEQVDPESQQMGRWATEKLAVASRWSQLTVRTVGAVPEPGELVVAIHAPRMIECATELGVNLIGLLDIVLAHEYSHHADGAITSREMGRSVGVDQAEHAAQLGGWNALTFLPFEEADRAKHAMLALAERQSQAYRTFIDLPAVKLTRPMMEDGKDPLLVPVRPLSLPGYPEPKGWISLNKHPIQEIANAETIILVSLYEEGLARDWILAVNGKDPRDVLMTADEDNPSSGVQLATGPYRLVDADSDGMIVGEIEGDPVRRLEYHYEERQGLIEHPRRLSTCGGRLTQAPPTAT